MARSADAPVAEPEEAPPGARFLATAPTLDALTAAVQADCAWRDTDGAPMFLWISAPGDAGKRTVTMNRAYSVRQSGVTFWAFLACPADWPPFASPLGQFLAAKHVRATVSIPSQPDPEHQANAAEVLSRAPDGREVLRVTCSSLGGAFPNHTDMRSYLVYVPGIGPPQLASLDLGADRSWHSGWICEYLSSDFEVVWCEQPAPAPFLVKVRQSRSYSCGAEQQAGRDVPAYTSFTDTVLSGPLPLGRAPPVGPSYTIVDGKTSLADLARALAFYESDWTDADWVTPAQRASALRRWREEVARANPTLPPDQALPGGTRIVVPDESATSAAILKQVRQSEASDNRR